MKQTKISPAQEPCARYLFYCVFSYFAFFSIIDLFKLWGFGYAIADFGLFRQIIWNTLNGEPFQYSIIYPFKEDANYIGYHFSLLPIIVGLPLYAIFPYPEMLCVLHVLIASVPALVIYATCLKLECKPYEALFWSIIYLVNPITMYHTMFSYAEMSFAPLMISLGIYFTISRQFLGVIISCTLLLLIKEHYGASVFGFGILWWWWNKSLKQGLLLAAYGLASLYIIIEVIMPLFRDYPAHLMLTESADIETTINYKRYQWLNKPIFEVIASMPEHIFSIENRRLFYSFFAPLILLPVGGIMFFFAGLADFMAIILSENPVQKSITLNYSPGIIPILVIASCYAVKKYTVKLPKIRKIILVILGIVAFVYTVDVIKGPISRLDLTVSEYMDWSYGPDFQEAMTYIPEDAFLITDEGTGSLISNRKRISGYNQLALPGAEYVLIRLNLRKYFFSNYVSTKNDYDSAWNLLHSPSWGLVYWKYPYVIFKKGATSIPEKKDLKGYIVTQSHYLDMYKPKSVQLKPNKK